MELWENLKVVSKYILNMHSFYTHAYDSNSIILMEMGAKEVATWYIINEPVTYLFCYGKVEFFPKLTRTEKCCIIINGVVYG